MTDIRGLAKLLRDRIREDYDVTMIITGRKGCGKTSLSLWIAKEKEKKYFSVRRNMLIDPSLEQLIKKIEELPDGAVIILDEAIRIAYKLDWNTEEQKQLNKALTLCRKHHKVLIFNIPYFKEISKFLRVSEAMLWIHIPMRGTGLIFVQDEDPFVDDAWLTRENRKVVLKYYHDVTKREQLIRGLRKCRNFLDAIDFEPMEGEYWRKYLEMRDEVSLVKDIEAMEGRRLFRARIQLGKCLLMITTWKSWIDEQIKINSVIPPQFYEERVMNIYQWVGIGGHTVNFLINRATEKLKRQKAMERMAEMDEDEVITKEEVIEEVTAINNKQYNRGDVGGEEQVSGGN